MNIKSIFLGKKRYIIISSAVILVAIIVVLNQNSKQEILQEEKPALKEVATIILNKDATNNTSIKTTGVVKPSAQVDVIANTDGTIRNIYFETGDKVWLNQILASVFSASTLTNLNNAETYYSNSQSNFDSIKRAGDEAIRQAELGVENAKKTIESAEITLKTMRDNLENAKIVREKNIEDTKTNAVNSYYDNLNTIFTTLDKVNYIINVDDEEPQYPSIERVLGVKDLSSLNSAETSYTSLKAAYQKISTVKADTGNIYNKTNEMIMALDQAKRLTDDVIDVLYNTISSSDFPETSLTAEKNSFTNLRSNLINIQTRTKNTLQALENLNLAYSQETDSLENAVSSAQSQLDSARLAYNNALIQVDSAREAQNQQLSSSRLSLDSAGGQLNLSRTQAGDLSLKAPIAGTITQKFVELGADVNPGQKIAEISNTEQLKVELSLSSNDIYRIEIGTKVKIMNDIEGTISSIDPAADAITKKVKVEITVDNKDNKLIQGTFIDVEVPTKQLEKTNDNSIFIPLKSVIITQNENFVFTVSNNKAVKKNITLGKTEDALIEVLEGLNEKDELVLEGGKNLKDGEDILIKN